MTWVVLDTLQSHQVSSGVIVFQTIPFFFNELEMVSRREFSKFFAKNLSEKNMQFEQ